MQMTSPGSRVEAGSLAREGGPVQSDTALDTLFVADTPRL